MTAATRKNKSDEMYTRIARHGQQLLALFPVAIERDPIKLCRALRRIETKANRAACDACNHQAGADAWDAESERASNASNRLLGTDRVWVNGDPRGYALKVDLSEGETLHRDWGGYGIIAPDLTSD